MRIKEAINMILWKYKDNIKDYEIIILDRKSPDGISSISFESLKGVDNNYLYLNDEIVIPIHRIIMIRRKIDNSIIWSRS